MFSITSFIDIIINNVRNEQYKVITQSSPNQELCISLSNVSFAISSAIPCNIPPCLTGRQSFEGGRATLLFRVSKWKLKVSQKNVIYKAARLYGVASQRTVILTPLWEISYISREACPGGLGSCSV